jgi:L-aminopeptidase/D-esterase-like protein
MAFGGSFALNASGEMTGLAWMEERGFFEGPLMITNTHSVGVVRDTTIQWMLQNGWDFDWTVPIVGETYDGLFNDINGGHILPDHVKQALDSARSGPVPEGSVGGGTGMMSYGYKSGIGTSSRACAEKDGGYTVGVLVQSNYGRRSQLRVAGIPVGRSLQYDIPCFADKDIRPENALFPLCGESAADFPNSDSRPDGSIIVVVATDAPLLPHQLRRLAKRPALAIGRLGEVGPTFSGDIFIAFSTANADAGRSAVGVVEPCEVMLHPDGALTPLFDAVVDATEEAIVNALIAAETCTGINGLRLAALPHVELRQLLAKHNLLIEPS